MRARSCSTSSRNSSNFSTKPRSPSERPNPRRSIAWTAIPRRFNSPGQPGVSPAVFVHAVNQRHRSADLSLGQPSLQKKFQPGLARNDFLRIRHGIGFSCDMGTIEASVAEMPGDVDAEWSASLFVVPPLGGML